MTGSQGDLASHLDGRGWTCIDFVSDLHLQASEPETWSVFNQYLRSTPAQALFILGDLFEVWIGDDVLDAPDAWEQQCVQALANASQRLKLFWIPGNRDFLTGEHFAHRAGCVTLNDPCRLTLSTEICLLSHGDALCLQDHDYMAFRSLVRSTEWQSGFLARSLSERQEMAQAMRVQSMIVQKSKAAWSDVDENAALQWLNRAGATRLIHGHTHQPADHRLDPRHTRTVLSDWSAKAQPPRCQILRWQGNWARINAKTP